jgi:hypothetical protein
MTARDPDTPGPGIDKVEGLSKRIGNFGFASETVDEATTSVAMKRSDGDKLEDRNDAPSAHHYTTGSLKQQNRIGMIHEDGNQGKIVDEIHDQEEMKIGGNVATLLADQKHDSYPRC